MKNRIYLIGIVCMLLSAACSDDAPDGPGVDEKTELKATFETVDGADARLWPEGTRINIDNAEYALSGGVGTPEATIGGVVKAERYHAMWPAAEGVLFSEDAVAFTLPNEQPYAEDNPGPFAAACGAEGRLEFSQLCGTLTFHFYGTGRITAVGLQAQGGEPISGPASARLLPGQASLPELGEGSENTLFLISDKGVELAAAPTAFRLYLPPGDYAAGFMMIVVDDAGNQMDITVPPIGVSRGADLPFEALKYDPNRVVKDWMTLRLESSTGPADRPDALWRENDGVTINGENFPISTGAGSKEAEVEKVRQTRTFWAAYPGADRITYSEGTFSVSLPRTQTWDAAAPYCGPMVAFARQSPLELRYLCGFLRLPLTGEGTVYELKLTGTGIVGDATVEGDENGIGDLKMEHSEAGEITIRLAGEGIVLSGQPQSVWCVLPPGNYPDLQLIATDTNGKTVEASVPGPLEISRGAAAEAASIYLRFSGGAGDAVDLSVDAAANCYIVPGPGRYSFATRRVSGTEVSDIARVDWVWATRSAGSETNELIDDLAYADGRISFTAGTGKGNVLVAALDDSGEILWSWHLWLTDDPRTDEMTYKCGKTFLDRNLGAVSAIPGGEGAAGVLYQWGRKDPFAGGKGEEDIYMADTEWRLAIEATVMNADYAWKTSYLGDDRSMAYATAHPTELLGDYQATTWTAQPDNTLWGSVKTDTDPCPPGYRVPEIDFSTEFSSGWSAEPGLSDLYLSGETYGLVYTKDGRQHFWPFAGQRWGDGDRGCYTNFNCVGCYWSISFAENGNPLNFNIVDNGVIFHTGDERWNTCQALSVRCCKE